MAPTHTTWMSAARCRGLDVRLFFPDSGQHAGPAQRVCASCPVRATCLEYALDAGEAWGVWGGATEDERRAMRWQRRAAA